MCKKIIRQCGALFCILGIILWMIACSGTPIAAAAEGEFSLTLVCQAEDVTLSEMQWNIYRVGERQGGTSYCLQNDFADYNVSMENLTDTALQDAADTLENYAILDKIQPLDTKTTDETGTLCSENLPEGLYLLSGTSKIIGQKEYIPSAALVELIQTEEGPDFTVYPKYRVQEAPSADSIDCMVQKIWLNDDAHPEDRSVELKVAIYQDAELAEEIVLSEENNWTYHWKSDTDSEWRVEEVEVPAHYTVVYRANETQYLIVNTHETEQISTEPPSEAAAPPSTSTQTSQSISQATDVHTEPASAVVTAVWTNNSGSMSNSVSSGGSKLPQTGQLWWPVPLLAGGGLICIIIGWRTGKKK